jgi:hypothetical protein
VQSCLGMGRGGVEVMGDEGRIEGKGLERLAVFLGRGCFGGACGGGSAEGRVGRVIGGASFFFSFLLAPLQGAPGSKSARTRGLYGYRDYYSPSCCDCCFILAESWLNQNKKYRVLFSTSVLIFHLLFFQMQFAHPCFCNVFGFGEAAAMSKDAAGRCGWWVSMFFVGVDGNVRVRVQERWQQQGVEKEKIRKI